MNYIPRTLVKTISASLRRKKSVLLLGPRQTGKTTLIESFKPDVLISLVRFDLRQRYEKNPDILRGEIELTKKNLKRRPLVSIDEVQKVPALMDVVQDLIDRNIALFILSGSSARKLKRGSQINLLPGRVVALHLDPLSLLELRDRKISLEDLLFYGSLPRQVLNKNTVEKELDLRSYVTTYLEEEIRSEALVRNVASFGRFLELASLESGQIINLRKLSQDVGVAHTTIKDYFDILVDCLIAERIQPITKSQTRKKLTKSEKFLIFDLGVRRLATDEGVRVTPERKGQLFEQFIGLELIRMARLSKTRTKILFWRDPGGPEIDWVIQTNGTYIPIETKWTDSPRPSDSKNVELFLKEYSNSKKGYVICRTPNPVQLSHQVTALPWNQLLNFFK
ncbi:MAG: ATP-binding protein [Elusimicrobiota bacterium]